MLVMDELVVYDAVHKMLNRILQMADFMVVEEAEWCLDVVSSLNRMRHLA